MKFYKFILGAVLSMTTVSCKVLFDDGGKKDPPPPICKTTDENVLKTSCTPVPYDLKKTPLKVQFFHGGWYGPSPNFALNMSIVRDSYEITATVETPECKASASVSP
ncbi:MAG: hypothetical protein IT287_07685, partial [Bdellovibrionaceae bacterium]|nr:hypothetical protein [Pseudobdellovibrionaceae bacterium]